MSYDEELKEINSEIKEKGELILQIQKQIKELCNKKDILIKNNCEHDYKSTDFCKISENGYVKIILKCQKCGKEECLTFEKV